MLRDTQASVMPLFAISLLAIISLAGASIALSFDSRAANNLQIAADEAALSGATAFLNTASPRAEDRLEAARAQALAAADANADYALANLELAAITEDPYGQHTTIEVALRFTPVNPAAQIAGRNANISIEREAAATATWGFPLCILALGRSGSGLSMSGETGLTAENCIIWTNATGTRSMAFVSGEARARHFCAAGSAMIQSASVTPRPHEDCEPIPDPLSGWTAPTPGSIIKSPFVAASGNSSPDTSALVNALEKALNDPLLKDPGKQLKKALKDKQPMSDSDVSAFVSSIDAALGQLSAGLFAGKDFDAQGYITKGAAKGMHLLEVGQVLGIVDNLPDALYSTDSHFSSPTATLSPGTYAGLDIAYGHVKLQPGVYHIVGAPLTVRRKATLSGKGVTIVLHGNDATLAILDSARVDLSAPVDGHTAGFTVAENTRSVLKGISLLRSRLTGAGEINIIGTIYVPRQTFSVTGDGAAEQASPLLQLVANQVELSEQGALKIRFDPDRTEVPMTILPAREARLLR